MKSANISRITFKNKEKKMKNFIISLTIVMFITFSIVSVAYPCNPNKGSQAQVCLTCIPKFLCFWGACDETISIYLLCHALAAAVPWAGGCCDTRTCTYYTQ